MRWTIFPMMSAVIQSVMIGSSVYDTVSLGVFVDGTYIVDMMHKGNEPNRLPSAPRSVRASPSGCPVAASMSRRG